MASKTCSKCTHEIKSEFEKCPYCGADQRTWYLRNKGALRFLLGVILVIFMLSVFVGPKLKNRNSSASGSGGKAAVISIGEETRTDEYIIKVVTVNIYKPSVKQEKLFQVNSDELLIDVEWQYEPIQNVKLTSSPFATLSCYPFENSEGETKLNRIILDEVTSITSKTYGEDLVRITNTFKLKKDILETNQWQLNIEADWSIGIMPPNE